MLTQTQPLVKQRIQSIDILRGIIMLVMALDHTRDFFHNAGAFSDPTNVVTTTPIFFFTRWITHFCAPTFVFLSGVSAFLAGTRRTKGELSAFLIKRGLWLILVEVVIISLAFSLDPLYHTFVFQVLWAIGISMVILGLLVRLPLSAIAAIAIIIIFGHDILDYETLPQTGEASYWWNLIFTARGSIIPLSQNHVIFDLYAFLPWTGIMLLGYVFGSLYQPSVDAQRRKKILRYTGIATLAAFIILRFINHYGDPAPWAIQRNWAHTLLSFVNVSKYPPSLFYTMLTVGTAMVLLSLLENVQNKLTAIFIVYGNVPFFYYILHFYLIRIFCVAVFFIQGFKTSQIISPNSPFLFRPNNLGFNLPGVYLMWLLIIGILYLPCRWFSKYKKSHHQWWLSYL
jgi:uncharacterized membrane protein